MSQYSINELKIINQVMFGLFIAADFAFFLHLTNSSFPWFSLLGAGIGLAIIVLCWSGKKFSFFVSSLLTSTVVFTIAFSWSAIFNLH